jgi:hypothetical protein
MNYKTDPTYATTYNNLRGSSPEHPAIVGAGVVHRLFLDNMKDQPCGGAPGNWGWLSFDGLPSDPNDIALWLENGWNEDVAIRTLSDPACPSGHLDETDSADGCVPSDSGVSGSNAIDDALASILNKPIYIMVFDVAKCGVGGGGGGGGTTCSFEAYTFLNVILRDYQLKSGKYLDFEFINHIISGKCCAASPANGIDPGLRVVKLCAVDHDTSGKSEATRCGTAP